MPYNNTNLASLTPIIIMVGMGCLHQLMQIPLLTKTAASCEMHKWLERLVCMQNEFKARC